MTGSDEDCVTKATANLSQFGERKFLNFNCFNDCRIHDCPLLREKKPHLKNHGRQIGNLGQKFLEEVSVRSDMASPKG